MWPRGLWHCVISSQWMWLFASCDRAVFKIVLSIVCDRDSLPSVTTRSVRLCYQWSVTVIICLLWPRGLWDCDINGLWPWFFAFCDRAVCEMVLSKVCDRDSLPPGTTQSVRLCYQRSVTVILCLLLPRGLWDCVASAFCIGYLSIRVFVKTMWLEIMTVNSMIVFLSFSKAW
jgi:hypothetical protein